MVINESLANCPLGNSSVGWHASRPDAVEAKNRKDFHMLQVYVWQNCVCE